MIVVFTFVLTLFANMKSIQHAPVAGAYTRSHFRSTRAHFAPFRSTTLAMSHIQPKLTHGCVPKVLKLSSTVSIVFPQVLKLSSEVSECKPLASGHFHLSSFHLTADSCWT